MWIRPSAGPLLFFLDYDFEKNPLEINAATLPGLRRNVDRFRELRLADSFTIDFQKWGYVPYTSSLVMIKNRADLKALEHDPEYFSYFEKSVEGQTHLHSTIECSRSATGLFGGYTAMHYLGVEGFQRLVANTLQNANYSASAPSLPDTVRRPAHFRRGAVKSPAT